VAEWYATRLAGKLPVLLLSNDRASRELAVQQGLSAAGSASYARTRVDAPELLDIAANYEEGEPMEQVGVYVLWEGGGRGEGGGGRRALVLASWLAGAPAGGQAGGRDRGPCCGPGGVRPEGGPGAAAFLPAFDAGGRHARPLSAHRTGPAAAAA
jgi:hypothetical protein